MYGMNDGSYSSITPFFTTKTYTINIAATSLFFCTMTRGRGLRSRKYVPRQLDSSDDERLPVLRSRLRLAASTNAYIVKLEEEIAELKHFKEWALDKFEENDVNRHRMEKEIGNLRQFNSWAVCRLSSSRFDSGRASRSDDEDARSRLDGEEPGPSPTAVPAPYYRVGVDTDSENERFPQPYYHRPANREEEHRGRPDGNPQAGPSNQREQAANMQRTVQTSSYRHEESVQGEHVRDNAAATGDKESDNRVHF